MNKNIINFLSFLIYLLPLALITGPFFPDLIISIVSLFFLFICFKNRNFDFLKNKIFLFLLLFWFFLLISSLFSDFILISLRSSSVYIRFILFSYVVYVILTYNKKFLNSFIVILFIVLFFVVFDSYYQIFFKKNLLGFSIINNYQISGIFKNEYILGSYLLKISLLIFALLTYDHNKYKNYFLFYFLVFVEPMIFFSGQRTPFYISLIFLLFLIFSNQLVRYNFLTLLFCICIILFNLNYNPSYKQRMFNDIKQNMIVNKEVNLDKQEKYKFIKYLSINPGHTNLWVTSINMFNEKKIFGHGPKTFRLLCENKKYKSGIYGCSTHPHSFLFQILSETGVVGLFFVIFGLGYLCLVLLTNFLKMIIQKKNLSPKYFISFVLLINFLPIIPSGGFFSNYNAILNFLPVGFLLFFSNK